MAVVGCSLTGVVILAALGFPVAPDPDVFRPTAILSAGLLRLRRRLGLLHLGGLGLRINAKKADHSSGAHLRPGAAGVLVGKDRPLVTFHRHDMASGALHVVTWTATR